MKTGIIYEWRNKLDGKFYVGQTINPESRYKDHLKAKGDSLFHRAIKKHGIENFEYSVVATYEHETSEGLYDLLNEAEKERIKFRNSLAPNGYNVADGGNNGNSLAGLTKEEYEEFCKKRSKANSGENNPMFGKSPKDFMTEEEIEEWGKNASIALVKYYAENPEAHVLLSEKCSGENNGMYGKHHSDETCALISEKNSGENSGWYGKHWYNNGIDEQPYFDGEQPEGWVIGRLNPEKYIGKNNGMSGKHWYNNGIDEHPYFDGEQPEGWVRGKLPMSEKQKKQISETLKAKNAA